MKEELSKYDITLIAGTYGSGESPLAKEHFQNRKRINRHEIRHYLKEMTEYGRGGKQMIGTKIQRVS